MANNVTPSNVTTPSPSERGAPSPNPTPEQLFTMASTRGQPEKSKGDGLKEAVDLANKNKNINDTEVMLGEYYRCRPQYTRKVMTRHGRC